MEGVGEANNVTVTVWSLVQGLGLQVPALEREKEYCELIQDLDFKHSMPVFQVPDKAQHGLQRRDASFKFRCLRVILSIQ